MVVGQLLTHPMGAPSISIEEILYVPVTVAADATGAGATGDRVRTPPTRAMTGSRRARNFIPKPYARDGLHGRVGGNLAGIWANGRRMAPQRTRLTDTLTIFVAVPAVVLVFTVIVTLQVP